MCSAFGFLANVEAKPSKARSPKLQQIPSSSEVFMIWQITSLAMMQQRAAEKHVDLHMSSALNIEIEAQQPQGTCMLQH